jgi:serine phosphatase RsbU (regulator of sigma subunit)
LYATGFPLGLFENAHYEEAEAWLSPEDTVLLYSDGLIEAHNEEGEMFGVEQVLDILGKISHDQMLDTLKTAMERHTGKPSDPEDDTTMLCLHRSKVTQVVPELRLDNDLSTDTSVLQGRNDDIELGTRVMT